MSITCATVITIHIEHADGNVIIIKSDYTLSYK